VPEELERAASLIEDEDFLAETLLALLDVTEDALLLELIDGVLRDTFGVVLMTGGVVFAVVFAVVFTTGFGAGLGVDFTTRTTGSCRASSIFVEASEIQLQAAVSSSGVSPRMADDRPWL
jgi:hypothetical protein